MAITLEELQIKFNADMGNLNSELKGIKQSIGGVEAPTGKATSAMAGFAKIGGMLAAAGIGAKLVSIGKESIQMANDAVESESLFEVSMGGMAESSRQWSEELSKALGLNAVEVRKSVGTFNVMFNSMDIGASQSQEMAQGLTELAQDMASFYNLDPTEAFQKLSAGITGEAEPLKRLGILIDENTISQYAMKAGISKTGKEMTQQQKVLARYGAIMEQTEKAQGDLARTMDSPTNQLRRMSAQVDAAKIALGTALQPALLAVLPVLTSLAVGAGNVINALSGLGNGSESFEGIALTLDEAMERIKTTLGDSNADLIIEIEQLDKDTTAALKDWAAAEKVTKKVAAEIEVSQPTTSGKERIDEALVNLKNSVPIKIDLRPIETKLNAILKDGEVTEKEKGGMAKKVNSWAEKIIKGINIDKNKQIKKIDAQLKAGEITEEKAGALKAAVEAQAEAAIGAVDVTVSTINAEIKAGEGSLLNVSFTPEQAAAMGQAISDEINAQGLAVNAQVKQISATWAGEGDIGTAVTSIYTDAQAAFIAKQGELEALAEKMLSGVSTEQMWADALRIKEEMREISEFMFKDNGSFGEIFTAAYGDDGLLSTSGIQNMMKAVNKYVVEETVATKKLLNERIADVMNLPPDIFSAKFPGKTPGDVIAELRENAAAEIAMFGQDAMLAGAREFVPSLQAALNSGKLSASEYMDYVSEVTDILSNVDFSKLSEDGRQAVIDLADAFGNNPIAEMIGNPILAILEKLGFDMGVKGEVAGKALTDNLRQALEQGHINKAKYDQIIGASASKQSLAQLAVSMATGGDTATAKFIEGLLTQQFGAEEATRLIREAAVNGLSGSSTSGIGTNFALGFIRALQAQIPVAEAAAADLATSAERAMKFALKQRSPSKVTQGIGDYFGEGFAIGITNSARRVSNAAAALANGATGALGGASVSTLNVPSLAQNDQMSAINRAVEQTLGRLNIELVVDGERLGRASIKAINQVQQRSGRTILQVT